MKRTIMVAAAMALLSASSASMAGPSGRTLAVTCWGCHGPNGQSSGAAPSLKGLPAAVVSGAMNDFKSGKRPATIMDRIAKGYSDADIAAMSDYISKL
ncbi:MAG: cytochrome C [Chromatiales bacterium]|nr:cytochrome C [Chromatiales bacterium]